MSNELDFWFSRVRVQRASRSRQGYVFARAAMGPPIRAGGASYAFADCLLNQNKLVMELEDNDALYRGDIKPGQAPLPVLTLQDLHDIVATDSDEGETEVEDSESDIADSSSPTPESVDISMSDSDESDVADSSSPAPELLDVSMSDSDESDVAQAGSPAPQLVDIIMSDSDESDVGHGSSPAPQSIDISMSDTDSSESDVDENARAPAPAVERLGSPFTPHRDYTYAKRDRSRFLRDRALDEAERLVAEQLAVNGGAAHPVVPIAPIAPAVPAVPIAPAVPVAPVAPVPALQPAAPTSPRRSARLNAAAPTHAQLSQEGHTIHSWINDQPRAVVDKNSYVVAVVSGGPKGETVWWTQLAAGAVHDMQTALHTADCSELAVGDTRLRYGISFGEEYAMPHGITNLPSNLALVACMENSDFLTPASAYQNHLYQQFAEAGHATVAAKMDELIGREIVFPAYDHSVFTTTEIELCNGLTPSHKNPHAAFDTMEVLTVFGAWNHKTGGGILFSDGDGVVELVPGATVIIASGTKSYALMPVGVGESRYVFRQYCHAGVLRWVEKGGRSDKEFDRDASYEEVVAWNQKRANRGRTSLKMFSRLGDVYS